MDLIMRNITMAGAQRDMHALWKEKTKGDSDGGETVVEKGEMGRGQVGSQWRRKKGCRD